MPQTSARAETGEHRGSIRKSGCCSTIAIQRSRPHSRCVNANSATPEAAMARISTAPRTRRSSSHDQAASESGSDRQESGGNGRRRQPRAPWTPRPSAPAHTIEATSMPGLSLVRPERSSTAWPTRRSTRRTRPSTRRASPEEARPATATATGRRDEWGSGESRVGKDGADGQSGCVRGRRAREPGIAAFMPDCVRFPLRRPDDTIIAPQSGGPHTKSGGPWGPRFE